jgi:hypothetical protein
MKNKNNRFIKYHTIMTNNKITELKNLITVYNKENPKLQTLGNTFTHRSKKIKI